MEWIMVATKIKRIRLLSDHEALFYLTYYSSFIWCITLKVRVCIDTLDKKEKLFLSQQKGQIFAFQIQKNVLRKGSIKAENLRLVSVCSPRKHITM